MPDPSFQTTPAQADISQSAGETTGFRSAFRIIRSRGLLRQTPLFIGLGFATILEGIGLATFIPILFLLDQSTGNASSEIGRTIANAFSSIGITQPSVADLFGIFMICVTAKSALMMFCMAHAGFATADFVTKLRYSLVKKVMGAKWSYFTEQPVGHLNHAIITEVKLAGRAYRAALRLMTRTLSSIIYIILAALVNPIVAAGGIVASALIGLVISRIIIATKQSRRAQARTTVDLIKQFSDVLLNLKPIKAMERIGVVTSALNREIQMMHNAMRKIVVTEQTGAEISELLLTIMMAIGFYIAISIVRLPIAEILVIGILIQRLSASITRANLSLVTLDTMDPIYWHLQALVEEVAAQREPSFGSEVPALTRALKLENVTFAYEAKSVLENVSLQISSGSIGVIIGQSGAGKTTIADLILGLHVPNTGQITLDGVSLNEIDIQKWRSMVGYVPQELLLFNDTILNNLTLGDHKLTEENAWAALEMAGAVTFVQNLPDGIHTQVGERGMMLSGGQRQRLAIARALITDPILLILDEATSALDPETEMAIVEAISKLAGGKITILSITHQPAWTKRADVVYRLAAGQVMAVEQKNILSVA